MKRFSTLPLFTVLIVALLGLCSNGVLAQTADFTSNVTSGCVPLGGVNFTDASTGGTVINRDWNLGNGTSIPNGAATVGTNYLTAGTFPVTLTVTFSNGTVRSVTKNIIVHPKPVASFIASDTAGCRPHTVSFTDLSTTATGTITSWQWDLGASGSTSAAPTFTYNTAGQYNISLIVYNNWGCQSDAATAFQYIKVYNPPVASFTANPAYGCKDTLTVSFANTTIAGSPGNVYAWNFGDGNTSTVKNPTHHYTAPGTYTVTLTVSVGNNCRNTTTRTVTISNFTAQFNVAPDTVCINTATLFSGSATPAASAIRWIFSDNGAIQNGASTSHIFTTLGDYEVMMIASNAQGCVDTVTQMVHVKSGANLAPYFISAPDTVCLNAPNTFSGSSTPAPATVRWIFSDNGAIQNGASVTHSFGALGDYLVTMVVYSAQGCTDTLTKMVHVKNRANLSPFFITAPDTVCLNSATVFEGGAAITPNLIRWQFSDNGAIQTNSPTTHSFAPPGTYQVSLYVYDAQGCADTLTRPIVVKSGPAASFTSDKVNGCGIPFTVTFTNTSAGNNLQFTWNFGDGSPNVVTNGPLQVQHTYNSFGNFTVTLTARDTLLNCPGPSATVLIRNIRPNVDFTYVPPSGCLPLPVAFTAQITNLIVPITSYVWSYGDGSTNDTLTTPTSFHLYSTAGTFNATLTIITPECTYTTIAKPVTVIEICDDDGSGGGGGGGGGGGAGFTVGKSCASKYTVTLTDTVRNTIVLSWNFGDGTPDYTTPPLNPVTYTYAPPQKDYVVTVIRLDTLTGLTDTAQKRVIIIDEHANFAPNVTDICVNGTVLFHTIGIDSSKINTYTWDFGDGTPRQVINNLQNFNTFGLYLNGNTSHVYADTGVYYVKLIITDRLGCLDSLEYPVPIRVNSPAAAFGAAVQISCLTPINVIITDSSRQNGSIPITNWQWSFGDGSPLYNTTVDTAINHLYGLGNYTIRLTITDAAGCSSTTTRPIVVALDTAGPRAAFGAAIMQNCLVPVRVMLTDSTRLNAGIPVTNWQWNFGDGSPLYNTTQDTAINHFYNPGSYTVRLSVTDAAGCVSTTTRPVSIPIDNSGPRAGFVANPITTCSSPQDVVFTDTSALAVGNVPIVEWRWTFGDGAPMLINTADTAVHHIYTASSFANFYSVTLSIRDSIGCTSTITKPNYIKLYQPRANFYSNDTLKCGSYNVFFFNTSAAYNATYVWHYGDGTTSTGTNGSHTYATEGDYNVKLVVTDENGCVDSIVKPSYIKLVKPVADFIVGDTSRCAPTAIIFTDNSQYSSAWEWDFGDGGTGSTDQNPTPHIYPLPGFYKVSLYVTGLNGCVDSTFKWIRVKGPIASLQAPADSGCRPLTFNGRVIGTFISTYAWDYGDGTPVNASLSDSIVTHVYTRGGMYLPNVVLVSPEGCPLTLKAPDSILVDTAKALFAPLTNEFCGTGTVSFSNLSRTTNFSSFTNYAWDFGDGSPVAGGAVPPPHVYGPGNYTVQLAVATQYGCVDTFRQPLAVVVHPLPIVRIAGDSIRCKPGLYEYTSNITSVDRIQQFTWYVNNVPVSTDSNLTYTFIAGNYNIKLVAQTIEGCSDSTNRNIIVDSVKALFSVEEPVRCAYNLSVLINNYSGSHFGINSYLWDYGDGTTSTQTHNPPHLYPTYGSYDVSLLAISVHGCRDSMVVRPAVTIHPLPSVEIAGDSIRCEPGTHAYTSVVNSIDRIQNFRWYVNNTLAGVDSNLNYHFIAGNYNIKLVVQTINGCYDSTNRNIIIDSVDAAFSVVNPIRCANDLSVQFTNGSGSHFGISSYLWDFGEGSTGSTSTLQNPPPHVYAGYGNYNVSLLVVSVHGCRDSIAISPAVILHPLPSVRILGDSIRCSSGIYQYTSAITSLDRIQTFTWYVNGVAVSADSNLTHSFAAGNYTIKLKVQTINGCYDSLSRTIIIDSVNAAFTVTNPIRCSNNLTVQFNNHSGSQFGINNYAWDFGDATTSTLQNPPLHIYPGFGIYNVSLLTVSVHGCRDSVQIDSAVIINRQPSVAISGDSIHCAPGTYPYAAVTNPLDGVVSWQWKVNGVLAGNAATLNRYFTAGNYRIQLIVTTDSGCVDSLSRNIIVDSVKAAFAVDRPIRCGNTDLTVNFTNQSGGQFNMASYLWNFGDAQTSTATNPVHTYPGIGIYDVQLIAYSEHGCTDTARRIPAVTIYVTPTVTISGRTDTCANNSMHFSSTVATQDNVTGYQWRVNGTPAGNNPTLDYLFTTAGIFDVTLHITTAYGCVVSDTHQVTIHALPVPNASPNTTICQGGSLVLRAYNGITYEWTPTASLQNPNTDMPLATPTQTTRYKVKVTNQFGCVQYDSITIQVDNRITLDVSPDEEICRGETVTLRATGNAQQYTWSPTTGLGSPNSAVTTASPSTTTQYTVTGTTSGNTCPAVSRLVTVTVGDIPTVSLGPDKTVSSGTSVTLQPVTTGGVVDYSWSPATGLNCTTCAQPSFVADKGITYRLEVRTQYGCTAMDEIEIIVTCNKGSVYVPNAFTPNGDRLNDVFFVSGYGIASVERFSIFDRWGKLIFQKQNIQAGDRSQGWDGTIKGIKAEQAAYVYIIEVICVGGDKNQLKGSVLLIR